MNGILGMTRLLLDTSLTAEQEDFAQTVASCAHQLLTVINDILDFSKIDAGRLEILPVSTNLIATIQAAVKLLTPKIEERELIFVEQIDPATPLHVLIDETRLMQILLNLLGNSIKFSKQSGSVVLSVWHEEKGKDLTLHFTVADTGIGIPSSKLESIFESFSQADGSTSRMFGGTGLGLTISRRLSRLMGGDIEAQSILGFGSAFHFWVKAEHSIAPRPRVDSGASLGMNITPSMESHAPILLAEDNAVNQRLTVALLRKMGISAQTVWNGADAISALAESPPGTYSLVLMDGQMPEVDGFEAARTIRASGNTIPIIAMTAYAMKGDRERCLAEGMDDYVTKPVDPTDFHNVVSRWLRKAPKPAQR
jgi:CheY-like chemotaxis protein